MSKYRAVRTNGYASKREANRAAELRLLEKAGVIANLEEQVSFDLLPGMAAIGCPRALRYEADFRYLRKFEGMAIWDPTPVVEDAKGVRTPVYKIKKRLMRQLLGIEITEV